MSWSAQDTRRRWEEAEIALGEPTPLAQFVVPSYGASFRTDVLPCGRTLAWWAGNRRGQARHDLPRCPIHPEGKT